MKLAVSEKRFQAQGVELARLSGWLCYHTFDSRGSAPGFPDLVMVRPPHLICAELKSESGELRPEQDAWLEALRGCEGVYTRLWRPSDWLEIRTPCAREEASEAVTGETAAYRTNPRTQAALLVTPDGSRLLARRPGRELFPASWRRHGVRISYDDGSRAPGGMDLSGVLLEWCDAGLIVQANASKSLLPWERVVMVELTDD